ncbi:MAG TPA: chemotaxis protein CheW [Myxococcaceae bacterium]|nr:chemotaxis protein CheW [Myxococcaceae bacterium]
MNLQTGEPLGVVRVGPWRLAIPLNQIECIFSAALPVALPSPDAPMRLQVEGVLLPVIFGAALFGAQSVEIGPEQKMVLISDGTHRILLWVDAVEDIVPYRPLPAPADTALAGEAWLAGFTGGDVTLAILDPAALARAALHREASTPSHLAG